MPFRIYKKFYFIMVIVGASCFSITFQQAPSYKCSDQPAAVDGLTLSKSVTSLDSAWETEISVVSCLTFLSGSMTLKVFRVVSMMGFSAIPSYCLHNLPNSSAIGFNQM